MSEYAIGLDIGVTSVGWAIVALDDCDKPCGIIGLGSRIFDAAEHPKTGESLATPRREARGSRRRLRRHRHRNERIRWLLLDQNVIDKDALDRLFSGHLEDIYSLRVRALDELLTGEELARLLIHLSQRRGFQSNRKNPSTDEDGLILSAVSNNQAIMKENGYRTVGEMLLRDPRFSAHKRNKGGEYIATVSRRLIEEEVHLIFAAQRKLLSPHATEALEDAYLNILLSQRSFDDGPGGNSPYGGNQIEKMVGSCTFCPDHPRAAKATYTFEYFTLLEKINHIRILHNGHTLPLTAEQRAALISLAHSTENVDFARIRKVLSLPDDARFNVVRYQEENAANCEKKQKLGCLRAYHQMRKALDRLSRDYILSLPVSHRDAIATALTQYKTTAKIAQYLEQEDLPEALISAVETIGNFSGYGHLSIHACSAIIPHLETGMNYSDACTAAGFQFKGHDGCTRTMLLHPTEADYESITSPVARRAISQTIKVVNAIIRKQKTSPTFINVEVARELAKSFSERNRIKKENQANQAANERCMARLREEFGLLSPSGQDLVKLKLYEQQKGFCPYSQTQMSISRLFESGYAEIDHIIPYSISFDNSYKNKVLVLASKNRDKGNRLPLQYLQGEQAEKFKVWVKNEVKDYKKRQLLLKETITEEERKQFRERTLQDTKTASRFILNYLNDHLQFSPFRARGAKHVTAVNGTITSYMRKRLGISKVRANGDLHHAVDALVVACTTEAMIQQISSHTAYRECRYTRGLQESYAVDESTGEVLKRFPDPWEKFKLELEAYFSSNPAAVLADLHLPLYRSCGLVPPKQPVFVSRVPQRHVTGAAHEATVKSPRLLDSDLVCEKDYVIVKRPLQELKLKNGGIEHYYRQEDDRLLYEALLNRLQEFHGDAKKAFAEEFRKPRHDGSPGPVVKKVKLREPTTLNVKIHGGNGVADNGSLVRTDVFYVEGEGYYLIPIYVADTLKKELPQKACVAHESYKEWKPMRDEDFVFSLYKNDLIRISGSKMIALSRIREDSDLPKQLEADSHMLYYQGMDISSAGIKCISHDNAYEKRLGVKTLESIEKYTVDVLGEYHRVKKEKRVPFTLKRG